MKVQELKLEKGHTQRSVRQWKDVKSKYAALATQKGRLLKTLEDKEKQLENEQLELKYAKEEQFRREIQEREKEILEERLLAELRMTERKLEMEKSAKGSHAKLPKLTVGTCSDWVRFENMFLTQVDRQPISDEEEFGYLLEIVTNKVRDKISNLKPSSEGYKIAWERLQS